MDCIGFLIACCLIALHATSHALLSEEFLKRLTRPKPGGILDAALKQQPPKIIPGINLQLGGNKQFGGSLGIGSFGFGFNLGGQWGITPGGGKGGVNLPPPPTDPHVPDLKPDVPDLKPQVPKPQYPWEGANKPRPNWEEYEEEDRVKHNPYEEDKAKHNPYEEDKAKLNPYEEEDALPDWSDIGEDREDEDFEKKSERFNNGDLTGGGLIQPRLNRRGGRSVESHVYHVPLLFVSNAKPFQVRVHSNPNALTKDRS